MSEIKKLIIEDLEKLSSEELSKVYKFIRRDIIANIKRKNNTDTIDAKDDRYKRKKSKVEYFVGDSDRINEGLNNRGLDVDSIISILHLPSNDTDKKAWALVYYKE